MVAEEESGVSPQNKRKEYSDRTKNYVSEKIPKERREQTVWRLKKMIIEIQGHADCKYARIYTSMAKITNKLCRPTSR